MKQLLILVITLVSITALAQDANPPQKILIGFSFSPDYSFRTLINSDGSSASSLVINSINNLEVAKFGYTTGLNIWFNCLQLVGFETGIQFSNKGYQTKNQDVTFASPDPSLPTKVKLIYAYQYIGIPLKAKFSFGKSKVHFISSVGVMTNFLLNVKQTANYEYANGSKTEKHTQSSTAGFNRVDIYPMVSVGIDYRVTNKIHLLAEPTFKYGVIKLMDAPVAEHLWNAGLNVGFYYALK